MTPDRTPGGTSGGSPGRRGGAGSPGPQAARTGSRLADADGLRGGQDGQGEHDGHDGHDDGRHDEPRAGRGKPAPRVRWPKLVVTPVVLGLALLATYLWITDIHLDVIEHNTLDDGNVQLRLWQHVRLTAISTFWVLVIAIPLGIALTRRLLRRAAPFVTALANIGQATPAIGLLALLVIWLGIGARTAIVGIVIYAVLPVLSNTVAGLRAIDPTMVEAARGIGMSSVGVLTKVELPLAVPLILAGVRTALVLNVGTATLATFGGGGGLGDLITSGIVNQRMPVLILGSILTVVLALFVDWLASIAEALMRPRGLESGT